MRFKVRVGEIETDEHYNLGTALGSALSLVGYGKNLRYQDYNESILVKFLKAHTDKKIKIIGVKQLDDDIEMFTEIEDC